MVVLLKLWGVAMLLGGGYACYIFVDVLFIHGAISSFPSFFIVLCLLGLLVSVTLIWAGFQLLKIKKEK